MLCSASQPLGRDIKFCGHEILGPHKVGALLILHSANATKDSTL